VIGTAKRVTHGAIRATTPTRFTWVVTSERSSHATSGGMRMKATSQDITIPIPPMKPNWRNPRNSVIARAAYDTPAASAADRVPGRADQTAVTSASSTPAP
jgi:hypothetical protein